MDKNKILEKSRKENENQDEREKAVLAKAAQKAVAVGGMLCAVLLIVNMFFNKAFNYAIWGIYLSMTGTMLLYKFICLKKKHELIFGVLQLIAAAAFIIVYFINEWSA